MFLCLDQLHSEWSKSNDFYSRDIQRIEVWCYESGIAVCFNIWMLWENLARAFRETSEKSVSKISLGLGLSIKWDSTN